MTNTVYSQFTGQEVPFPAVSLSSFPMKGFRYPNELLAQLEFDCSGYNLDEKGEECMERTAAVRTALRPEFKDFIQSAFDNLEKHLWAEQNGYTKVVEKLIRAGLCHFMAAHQNNLEFLKYYYEPKR